MSVSTSNDPIQAVIDILDNSVSGDWANTGAKPTYIERQEVVNQNIKGNRTDDAIYVYSASDRSYDQFGFPFTEFVDSQRVSMDIWTVGDDTTDRWDNVEALRDDIIAIFEEFVQDNQAQTAFGRFHPVSSTDLRDETVPSKGDHARIVLDYRVQVLQE